MNMIHDFKVKKHEHAITLVDQRGMYNCTDIIGEKRGTVLTDTPQALISIDFKHETKVSKVNNFS